MGAGARAGPGALGEAPSAQASPPNPRLREKVRGRPGKEPRRAWVGGLLPKSGGAGRNCCRPGAVPQPAFCGRRSPVFTP